MSVGAYLQLAAKGPQELVLYGNDKSPFVTHCYKTHTPFAIETKENVFPNGCAFGKEHQMIVPRDGDLLGNIVLEIHLPVVQGASAEDAWVDAIGYVLLRRVKFAIDDVEISNSERLWYDISDRLFLKQSKRAGLDEMIGKNSTLSLTKAHIVYVPLKLFCCKDHRETQNFLPILTSPGSKMYLTIEFESFDKCVASYTGSTPPTELTCTVLTDYVFLERAERERMINRPHTLLIETEQDAEALTYKEMLSTGGDARVPLDSVKVDLSEVNYPVKYLVWVIYASDAQKTKTYFTYLDEVKNSVLLLDGNDRFSSQNAGYFQLVQKYNYATRTTGRDGVYMYNFGLDASSWQPCGHLTFGEVSLPMLHVDLVEKRPDRVVKVFIVGYKFLDVRQGRLTVRFS